MYYISGDEQLRYTIAFAYGDSPTARATTGVDWEVATVVIMPEQGADDVESEEGVHDREMRNYFISFEISEE